MATNSNISFKFKLAGSYWDNSYDPFYQFTYGPEANTPDAMQFDERGYWVTAGTSDGQQGVVSKMLLVPNPYQLDYKNGYEAGSWFRKVANQG